MAPLANDTYPDIDGTHLSLHAIQGVNVLSYDYSGLSNDYQIHFTSVRNQLNVPARCRINLDQTAPVDASNFVLNWGDFFRGSVDNAFQVCSIAVACDSLSATFAGGGIWLEARRADSATMNFYIMLLDDAGATTREVQVAAGFAWAISSGKRMEIDRSGSFVRAYASDLSTGANRTLLGTLTLTLPERQFYDNGNHQDVGFQLKGTPVSAAMFLSAFELNSTGNIDLNPTGSTLGTLGSSPPPQIILRESIAPLGSGLQTLASGAPAIQSNVTPIGSSLGRIVTGLPVFTGAISEAAKSEPPASEITHLATPPQKYNQFDESQTRREIEQGFTRANVRTDLIDKVIQAQVVTEGAVKQVNASDLLVLTVGVPVPLDFPTVLTTRVPDRWSMPTDGMLAYTADTFARLGVVFVFFELNPVGNNQTFIVELLINGIVLREFDFRTGIAALNYPVTISDLIEYPLGTTTISLQVTNAAATANATVFDFSIQSADFFSALSLDLSDPGGSQRRNVVPIPPTSFMREIVRNMSTLLRNSDPIPVDPNQHFVSGNVSLGALATGYVQQRGAGLIVIAGVNTWTAFDPVTSLTTYSSAWLQPADGALSINSDTIRVLTINMAMNVDTAAANQVFELRLLLNGVPYDSPYVVPLVGNSPEEHAFGFIVELPAGLTTLSVEVQNVVSGQDLDVLGYSMSVTDNFADG